MILRLTPRYQKIINLGIMIRSFQSNKYSSAAIRLLWANERIIYTKHLPFFHTSFISYYSPSELNNKT